MNNVKELSVTAVTWLKEKIDEKGLSLREAAKKMGISHPTLSNIISNRESPSYDTCVAISKWTHLPLNETLKLFGLLPAEVQNDPELQEMVGLLEQLDEADREDILRLLQTKVERYRKGKSK